MSEASQYEAAEVTSPADLMNPNSKRVFRSKNSKFYHRQHCVLGREIHERNRQYYSTPQVAEFERLKPCHRCSVVQVSAISKLLR